MYALNDSENVNSNLIAIGMYMNVADYTAKLTKEQEESRKSDNSVRRKNINVSQIWQDMFGKMACIAKEPKAEIRRSLIQIMENVIVHHGSIF
jgi:DNA topoisomerase VI subunit B